METATFANPQFWIAAAVIQPTTSSNNSVPVWSFDGSTQQAQYIRVASGGQFQVLAFNTGNSFTQANAATLSNGTPAVTSSLLTSGQSLTASVNGSAGTPVSQTGTARAVTVPLNIFNQGSNPDFNGLIGDIILTSTATTSISNKIIGFLAWKYGLQANLPNGFPYQSRPPYVNDP
jgi:hypothetical protein